MRVLRVTHDKGWINDDDPGSTAVGWLRQSNLGTGDYNNDLTTSSTPRTTWTSTFTGSGIDVYAPKQSGAGKIEIQIDGQVRTTADLSTTGARQPQQLVAQVTGMASGPHTVSIVNRGPGPVAVDALGLTSSRVRHRRSRKGRAALADVVSLWLLPALALRLRRRRRSDRSRTGPRR